MSTRLSLTSHRDTWDYFRIDPDAVALSKAQAQELCRLDDDVKRHLFSHFPEFLRCLLPEHREEVMATIGRFDTADRIPDRRNPASVPRPDLTNLASTPLSDDEAAAVVVETLAVVEEMGEALRRKLRAAVTKRDRDELHKLMSTNIWSRWFLSHVIAPFLDDYAVILDGMGIDPEQVRQQAASHHAARAPDPAAPAMPSPVQPVLSPSDGDATPSAPPSPPAPIRANGLPSALGSQPPAPPPNPRPNPKPGSFTALHPAAASAQAATPATPAAPATQAAPPAAPPPAAHPPSLPSTPTPAAHRRPFSTTVVAGKTVIEMSTIDQVADAVPNPESMETAHLATSYGTLLTLTDAIEARLREDLPDAPFAAFGAPANTNILQVITHPLGKSYARALNNRVTIATTLLDRPDIAPHLAGSLRPLRARLSLDAGRPLPDPSHEPIAPESQPATQHTLAPQPVQPPQQPSAAPSAARDGSHTSFPQQNPSISVHQTGSAAPAAEPPSIPDTPPASQPVLPNVAAPAPPPVPQPPLLATPAGATPGTPAAFAPPPFRFPASAPGTAFPGHAQPFPAATTQPANDPPVPPPLTAGPQPPRSSHRAGISNAATANPKDAPPAQAAPTRRLGKLPSPAILIAPAAAAIDLIVTGLRSLRKAAAVRKASRRQCAPPPATQPRSTALRALAKVLIYSFALITLTTAGLFAWRVYQAPASWLLAAPAQVRYVVPAYKALVPVFSTPEDARLARIDPGKTPTINPGGRYPVIDSQGDVLRIAITDPHGKPITGWVSSDLMRDASSNP